MRNPNLEYWTIENTGYSGGSSWFESYATNSGNRRFDTREKAYKIAYESSRKSKKVVVGEKDLSFLPILILHRIVLHRFSQTENSRTHYEKWELV